MKEANELTRRLLAEGYVPEDTPPGMQEYKPYYGGWTYDSQTLNNMVFETPCGLLVEGGHSKTDIRPTKALIGDRRMTTQSSPVPVFQISPVRSGIRSFNGNDMIFIRMMSFTSAPATRLPAPILMKAVWMKRMIKYGRSRKRFGHSSRQHIRGVFASNRAAMDGRVRLGVPITVRGSVPWII